MDQNDHVQLLAKGVVAPEGVWADFGSGRGAFTLALAQLIGPFGEIHSVDRDQRALRRQEQEMCGRFPGLAVRYLTADFTKPLQLPPLDGIVMANSLHFLRHKDETLGLVRGYLKPAGRLLLVEYNTDRGNPWVPYPLSYPTWVRLAKENGFLHSELLATRPSRFMGEIYSAASW